MGIPSLIVILFSVLVVEASCWVSFRHSLKGIDFDVYGNLNVFTRNKVGLIVILHTLFLLGMIVLFATTLEIL